MVALFQHAYQIELTRLVYWCYMSAHDKARFLFTDDKRVGGPHENEPNGACKRLYTRMTLNREQFNLFDIDEKDSLFLHMKDAKKFEEENSIPIDNFKAFVDILLLENDDFVQYHGDIDDMVLEEMSKTDLISGASKPLLQKWICGLLIDGRYDDGEKYIFELNGTAESFSWNIKVLHSGLFKSLLKVQLSKKVDVDMDEYFLDDLEAANREIILLKKRERGYELSQVQLQKSISKFQEKIESNILRGRVHSMKDKIMKYFLPTINELLSENDNLLEELGRRGNVFRSSMKRSHEEMKAEESERGEEDEEEESKRGRKDKYYDLMQKERKKRLEYEKERTKNNVVDNYLLDEEGKAQGKSNESVPAKSGSDEDLKFINDAAIEANLSAIDDVKADEDGDVMFVSNKRNLPETTPTENLKSQMDLIADELIVPSNGMVLNEDTQLDDETDISGAGAATDVDSDAVVDIDMRVSFRDTQNYYGSDSGNETEY